MPIHFTSISQPRFGSARPLTDDSTELFEKNAHKNFAQGESYVVQEERVAPGCIKVFWSAPAKAEIAVNNGREFRRGRSIFNLEEPKNPVETVAQHALAAEINANKFAIITRDKGKLWLVADGLSGEEGDKMASNLIKDDQALPEDYHLPPGFIADRLPVSQYLYCVADTKPKTYVVPITNGPQHALVGLPASLIRSRRPKPEVTVPASVLTGSYHPAFYTLA